MDWPECDFIRDVEENTPNVPMASLTGWETVIFELEDADYLFPPPP